MSVYLGESEAFVHRLGVRDMGLYGLFPETDRFTAVVCDCGCVVKPQGLKNHLARNHSGSVKYSGTFLTFHLYSCLFLTIFYCLQDILEQLETMEALTHVVVVQIHQLAALRRHQSKIPKTFLVFYPQLVDYISQPPLN